MRFSGFASRGAGRWGRCRRRPRPRPRAARAGAPRCGAQPRRRGDPDRPDAPVVDVVAAGQPGDRGVEVFVELPGHARGPSAAVAMAAQVDGEHPVAVTREHPRMRRDAVAVASGAVQRDDGRASARRDVPPAQGRAVGALECDRLLAQGYGSRRRRASHHGLDRHVVETFKIVIPTGALSVGREPAARRAGSPLTPGPCRVVRRRAGRR
jgi:hypothetical protein